MSPGNLWAPWRLPYILGLDKSDRPVEASTSCFLCEAAKVDAGTDAARDMLVIARDEHALIMLNRYPYTNGHLLVAPLAHVPALPDLEAAGRAALMETVNRTQQLIETASHPQGINIGINVGRCAGAGLPGHLHVHLVPRWSGDTNYMSVIGNVRVVPQALEETWVHMVETMQSI